MNYGGTKWGIYDDFLKQKRYVNKNQNVEYAQNSIQELAHNDASYQCDALRNGNKQPILALRKEGNVCKFTTMPEDNAYVGDIVQCYNEFWIIIDAYKDEYGITTGTMWLCNHVLKFQNSNLEVVGIHCVIDDGSYSRLTQKSITTPEAQYTMYLPLTDDTKKFYIDKRFAIGIGYDRDENIILQVMKATWIDKIYQNGATGNHLLKVRLQADVYDASRDNVNQMVCDYMVDTNETSDALVETNSSVSGEGINHFEGEEETKGMPIYSIFGKNTIRIGTKRTYSLSPEYKGNVDWSVAGADFADINSMGNTCSVLLPLDETLIGKEIILEAGSNGQPLCNYKIKVVAIG